MKTLCVIFLALALPLKAVALNVFACEPEWGSLVAELAGDKAAITVATEASQDAHHVQARPSLISQMRRADLVVCTGASLEIGWLPVLLRQSTNRKVQQAPGLFYATDHVELINATTQLDRAQGDVHPEGNPHVHLDPTRLLTIAQALSERLQTLDAANATLYQQRLANFSQRWSVALAQWQQQAASLTNVAVIVHHDEWAYLLNWLGIRQVGELEPKPGLPPTPSHLASLVKLVDNTKASLVIFAPHNNSKASNWLAKHSLACAVKLPFTVGGNAQATDLFALYDNTIKRLVATQQECPND